MTPDSLHDFFAASVSVAGALIGLLFVAISVAPEQLTDKSELQVHRIRAQTALTSFLNALVVGLFALIPGEQIGDVEIVVAIVGLLFIAASLLSLLRLRLRPGDLRDATFLLSLPVVFVVQLVAGLHLVNHSGDVNAVRTVAVMVVVCSLIGVGHSWALIGGPSIQLGHELALRARPGSRDAEKGARNTDAKPDNDQDPQR